MRCDECYGINICVTRAGTAKVSVHISLLTNLISQIRYLTTPANDVSYLKLDRRHFMVLNSSISSTGNGKFIGDGDRWSVYI